MKRIALLLAALLMFSLTGCGYPVKIFYMIGRSRPENSRHPAPCSRGLPPEKTKHPAEPAGKTLQI